VLKPFGLVYNVLATLLKHGMHLDRKLGKIKKFINRLVWYSELAEREPRSVIAPTSNNLPTPTLLSPRPPIVERLSPIVHPPRNQCRTIVPNRSSPREISVERLSSIVHPPTKPSPIPNAPNTTVTYVLPNDPDQPTQHTQSIRQHVLQSTQNAVFSSQASAVNHKRSHYCTQLIAV
jgi:hypothetical protein